MHNNVVLLCNQVGSTFTCIHHKFLIKRSFIHDTSCLDVLELFLKHRVALKWIPNRELQWSFKHHVKLTIWDDVVDHKSNIVTRDPKHIWGMIANFSPTFFLVHYNDIQNFNLVVQQPKRFVELATHTTHTTHESHALVMHCLKKDINNCKWCNTIAHDPCFWSAYLMYIWIAHRLIHLLHLNVKNRHSSFCSIYR